MYLYLRSFRGKNTPLTVKARLLTLDWESLGARAVPTDDQVHVTRCWLEDMDLADARRHLRNVREAMRRAALLDEHPAS